MPHSPSSSNAYPPHQQQQQHPLLTLAEKLPFLHPQPSPRTSRDWSDNSRRTSIGLPTPIGKQGKEYGMRRRHRRQLSLSSFSPRGLLFVFLGLVLLGTGVYSVWRRGGDDDAVAAEDGFRIRLGLGGARTGWRGGGVLGGNGGGGAATGGGGGGRGGGRVRGKKIPLGQSRNRGGREVFWWEQFETLKGYFGGLKSVVKPEEWISEQDMKRRVVDGVDADGRSVSRNETRDPNLVRIPVGQDFVPCYIDEKKELLPPRVLAYRGLPAGFPAPLLGSGEEIGLRGDLCYDRINRFAPYGYGFPEEEGGLGVGIKGDTEGLDVVVPIDYRGVKWGEAQQKCMADPESTGTKTAFVIRTWDGFEYTPYHIMMLRSIISELSLATGGKYAVHFLIHVQNDSIPLWASDEIYNQVLNSSLPAEFAGMGSLWSVAEMKLIYPTPFSESIVNFSGDDVYEAYRSLHFPLQYFAENHVEYDYFWQWEMDMRVTGGYLELLEEVTRWAQEQEKDQMWERSAKFFIPDLFQGSYAAYGQNVRNEHLKNGKMAISDPQLPMSERLSIPDVTDTKVDDNHVDLITFSPLFDPQRTRWAFHDDITGYPSDGRPPTRAALITASRLSRRLLRTMHHEVFQNKHTMFPEMFPASVALHYGYSAVYAPLPIYFDRDWPSQHADEIFNNAVIGEEARRAGMDHGGGHFHGQGGSVFGPGEHVFRGASWYSNANFAGYLWRRWLGEENGGGELEWEKEKGRMCLPMMVLHPAKLDFYK